ncbi:MAG: hypothetical protein ACREDU_08280, partial [Methylocella sp.]
VLAGVTIFLIFQSPKDDHSIEKSRTFEAEGEQLSEARNVAPLSDGKAGQSNPSLASNRMSKRSADEPPASDANGSSTTAKEGPSVQVGDVTSNDQTGGITAGYIGEVKKD